MVALGVGDSLADRPPVRSAVIQGKEGTTPGVAVGRELGVFLPVRGDGLRHVVGRSPHVAHRGHPSQRLVVIEAATRQQLDPSEDLVTDHHPEGPGVAGHVRSLGCLVLDRLDRLIGGVAELLPLVQQAGVHLADRFSHPGLQVVKGLGLGVLGHILDQRLVGLA